MAEERFQQALSANRTNAFAYEYLGFIHVHKPDAAEAVRNFELACKFAETDHHRALSLSHLARCLAAQGDLAGAIRAAIAATDCSPGEAKYWYACAVYRARERNAAEALRCLRKAIANDVDYWGIAAIDENLSPVRKGVTELLDSMREEARAKAEQEAGDLERTLHTLRHGECKFTKADAAGERDPLLEFEAAFEQVKRELEAGTVLSYRAALESVLEVHRSALLSATNRTQELHKANRQKVPLLEQELKRAVQEGEARQKRIDGGVRERTQKRAETRRTGTLAIVGIGLLVLLFSGYREFAIILVSAASLWLAFIWLNWQAASEDIESLRRDHGEAGAAILEAKRHFAEQTAALAAEDSALKKCLEWCESKRASLPSHAIQKGIWP